MPSKNNRVNLTLDKLKQMAKSLPFVLPLYLKLVLWRDNIGANLFSPWLYLYTRKLAGKYKKVELLKPLPGSKPRILLLTDYTLVRGAKVDSAYELWGMSLKEANIADFKRLCFQKDNKSKKTMIKQIFEICAKNNPQRPDYIFFAFGGAFNLFPDPLIWRILLNVCPTPMFALLADSEQKFIKYLENIPQLKGVVSIDAATPCQKSLL